jgi:hypothetical protein
VENANDCRRSGPRVPSASRPITPAPIDRGRPAGQNYHSGTGIGGLEIVGLDWTCSVEEGGRLTWTTDAWNGDQVGARLSFGPRQSDRTRIVNLPSANLLQRGREIAALAQSSKQLR